MLDDQTIIANRDPKNALNVAANEYAQAAFDPTIWNEEYDHRQILNVVVAGMGGSALAALLAKAWLKSDIGVPFEVLRSYDIPAYVGENTLFIASSYSGNTEETLEALEQAERLGAQLAVISSGGHLIDEAVSYNIAHVSVPDGVQPRMAMIYDLRALVAMLEHFEILKPGKNSEIQESSGWLKFESEQWAPDVPADRNYAKQLALQAVGKTPVFYGGPLTAPVAYKWKISWNENAKNVAFWNEYPEFNHNEFIGWTSHPIEKPFAVFDIVSSFESDRILKRFSISDRLLSGLRPKATTVNLRGDTALQQLLWGAILADFVSIYVAILNGVDPTPVDLIEKFKAELA